MTPTLQLVKHNPSIGDYGDCARACIAALLDMDPVEVVHFGCDGPSSEVFWSRINKWLADKGWAVLTVVWDCDVPDVLKMMEHHNEGVYWMMGCASPKANHFVVCCGGEIVCDPAGYGPDVKFTRDDSGYVWGNFLVPLNMKRTI